jgi:hypothetical protein
VFEVVLDFLKNIFCADFHVMLINIGKKPLEIETDGKRDVFKLLTYFPPNRKQKVNGILTVVWLFFKNFLQISSFLVQNHYNKLGFVANMLV